MKKLLFLFAIFAVISCSKEDEPNVTTYQITNNSTPEENDIEHLDGTLYEVVVFKFIGDDLAGEDNLDNISAGGGTSDVIELDERIDKIKVSFKILPEESSFYEMADRSYLASYTFVEQEINNEIAVDGNTMVKGTLKSISLKKLIRSK